MNLAMFWRLKTNISYPMTFSLWNPRPWAETLLYTLGLKQWTPGLNPPGSHPFSGLPFRRQQAAGKGIIKRHQKWTLNLLNIEVLTICLTAWDIRDQHVFYVKIMKTRDPNMTAIQSRFMTLQITQHINVFLSFSATYIKYHNFVANRYFTTQLILDLMPIYIFVTAAFLCWFEVLIQMFPGLPKWTFRQSSVWIHIGVRVSALAPELELNL